MKSSAGASAAQLAMVAAAASLALMVGALTGCGTQDVDPAHTGVTTSEPAASDAPAEEPRSEADPGAAEGEPTGEPRSEADPGAGEEESAGEPQPVDADETGQPAGSSAPEDADPLQPEPGPVLEWTEIDPGFDDLFELKSVGDGQVIARAWTDGDGGFFGQRIVVSANGTGWTEVPIPANLFPEQVNVSGDRWVVTGRIPDVDRSDIGPDRVFFSDDQGATWTEVAIDIPAETSSPYAGLSLWASSVLVSGERIVVPLLTLPSIDGQALLYDLGLLPPGKRVTFSVPTPDGVSFTLIDADAPYPYSDLTSVAFSLVSTYGALVITDWPDVAYDELDLTYEEVGLTFDEVSGLPDPLANPFDVLQTRLYVSDGPSGEVAASFDSLISSAAATADGFVLIAVHESGGTVLSSPDGLSWSEGPSLGPDFFAGTVAADGTIWTVTPGVPSLALQRAAPGQELETVVTLDGLIDAGPAVTGPAGLVLTATAEPGVSPAPSSEPVGGDDMASPLGTAAARSEGAAVGDAGWPEQWVGWSADSRRWGWESLSDAFGIDEATIWAEFAVGQDFVIARVAGWEASDPADVYQALPPRWFRARVP